MVLAKTICVINDIFWIIFINFHDTWVHCWKCKIVINVWVNLIRFFFRDKVIICLVIGFILLNSIVFHILFLVINKVSVFFMMVHMINLVIWVFKLDWFWFWKRASGCCLKRAFFCMCLYFYCSPLDLFYVCDCYEVVVIWFPLCICTMVL